MGNYRLIQPTNLYHNVKYIKHTPLPKAFVKKEDDKEDGYSLINISAICLVLATLSV